MCEAGPTGLFFIHAPRDIEAHIPYYKELFIKSRVLLGIDPVNQINKKSTFLSSTYLMRDGIEQRQESIYVFQETFKN